MEIYLDKKKAVIFKEVLYEQNMERYPNRCLGSLLGSARIWQREAAGHCAGDYAILLASWLSWSG